jgi:hypothetical protein
MKDFCNVAERDYIRLIVAQDLRESGIDVDSSSLGGAGNFSSSNMTSINMSHNNSHISHDRHHLSTNNNLLNTSLSTNPTSILSNSKHSYHHANMDMMIMNHNNGHDSHLMGSNANATTHSCSTRTFGLDFKQLEMVNLTCNEQLLNVPM